MISEIAFWRRPRKTKFAPALELALIPWLIATATVTLLPHFEALPPWLPIGATLALAWRGWLWKKRQLSAHKGIILFLAFAGTAGILAEYRTIFGREPGVALLVLLMSLKLMELRSYRDAVVVVMLGYFLLLTHYFYADSIPVGLWMLGAMGIATATLIRLQAPHSGSTADTLKQSGKLIIQAMPIMAILFILFPRINGPLWGLPQDAKKATTGLSEEMSPGSISQLSQSTALAFRAEFKGSLPARDLLYWRGPVMNDYDGRTWKVSRTGNNEAPRIMTWSGEPAASAKKEDLAEYTVTQEPHQQRWLLALDLPIKSPADTFMTPFLSIVNKIPVRDRIRLEFTSLTRYRAGNDETPNALRRALALPRDLNPRSRELALRWKSQTNNAGVIAAKALQLFQEENFVYTLQPPLLGRDAIDEFIFSTKRGFCEHYASSFVFLMRAADVPARVVAGYLGGEINPIDGHLAVRQMDAHAWAEIWIQGEGWRRIDPTASIAPNRVEQGLQASLPEGEALPAMLRPELDWLRAIRYRWDAIDYTWNRWVLGYNEERQRQVLKTLGIDNDWKTLIALLASFTGLTVLVLSLWITRRLTHRDRAQALWIVACDSFERLGLTRVQDEGPIDYANRVAMELPEHRDMVLSIANHYIRLRYTHKESNYPDHNADYIALYREISAIAPRWKLWSLRLCILIKN